MRFDEVTKCVIGLSCPVFGVRSNPPDDDRAIAQRVIAFMEECGVPSSTETVLTIRDVLSAEIADMDMGDGLYENLKGMRSACRKFLKSTQCEQGNSAFIALGELRATLGIHLVCIAARYGLDIDDSLAPMLPVPEYDHLFPAI